MASLIYSLIFLALQASENVPPPTNNPPPPGGQLPIDENIWILLVVGILFGIYILYKRNQATNKAS